MHRKVRTCLLTQRLSVQVSGLQVSVGSKAITTFEENFWRLSCNNLPFRACHVATRQGRRSNQLVPKKKRYSGPTFADLLKQSMILTAVWFLFLTRKVPERVTWSNDHADLCIETAGERMSAVTRQNVKQKLRGSKNLNTPRHIVKGSLGWETSDIRMTSHSSNRYRQIIGIVKK